MPQGLQLVIGADSQHSFSVYKDTSSNIVKVFYWMSFYDSASMDKDSFEYKHLLGRLYISGIRVKTLIEHFGFSYPTYKRWGDAIRSGAEERIYIAFSGQGGKHKKLTPDIIAFISHGFEHVYKRNKYSYSQDIRQDIKEVFWQGIVRRTHQAFIEQTQGSISEKGRAKRSRKIKDLQKPYQVSVWGHLQSSCNCQDIPMTFEGDVKPADSELCMSGNRMVAFENIRTSPFNFHVGILIFTPFLNKLAETGLGFIRQWLVYILLGCQNIEQNKKLNYSSLSQLIGSTPKTLRTQRSPLKEATTCA